MHSILQARPRWTGAVRPQQRGPGALRLVRGAMPVAPLYIIRGRAYIRKCDGVEFPSPPWPSALAPEELL